MEALAELKKKKEQQLIDRAENFINELVKENKTSTTYVTDWYISI